jgi:uncharacterized protein YjbI with pentapeptide repeats
LLTDKTLRNDGRSHAIRLRGSRIAGTLDLSDEELMCPLELVGCYFEQAIWLSEANARRLVFAGCYFPELRANGLNLSGSLELDECRTQRIVLLGAKIEGSVVLNGARLTNENGTIFDAGRARVGGSVFFGDGFKAFGQMRLAGAHIGDQLILNGTELTHSRATAFDATALRSTRACSAVTTSRSTEGCTSWARI